VAMTSWSHSLRGSSRQRRSRLMMRMSNWGTPISHHRP
jgi:hypothetical protein